MKVRCVALVLALFGAFGLVNAVGTVGEAHAAAVYDTPTRFWLALTPAETKQLAASGIASIYDTPALVQSGYVNLDPKSRYQKFYVPGRGYVVPALGQKMVNEAAAHPYGRVWISYNKTVPRPVTLTLWTRW